ncbi:hypothetical protein [Mycoplasma sp. E35C]|uniref:hypothetical protein n=1 Tax=Mycoplasma sp. E35C TaxID=2801918 RepID=UPI001CA3D38F|nr:hypothetical protein [Mycoplasma sp. E35C]QZX49426.1 hypothetical protein JJE79_01615 [Mycoplasma sp. E35C]
MTKFKKSLIPLIGLMGISAGLIAASCAKYEGEEGHPSFTIPKEGSSEDYKNPFNPHLINAKKEEQEWERNQILGSYDFKMISAFLRDNQLKTDDFFIREKIEKPFDEKAPPIPSLKDFDNNKAKELWNVSLDRIKLLSYRFNTFVQNYWFTKTKESYELRYDWDVKFTGLSVKVETYKDKKPINTTINEENKELKYEYRFEGYYTALGFVIQNRKYPDITIARLYDEKNRDNNNPLAPMNENTKIGYYILKGDGKSGLAIPFGIGLGKYIKTNISNDPYKDGEVKYIDA